MDDMIEMGTVSSRGQVCIPNNIRDSMGLEEGSKVLFMLSNGTLIMKQVTPQTFEQITKPLKDEMKKAGMKESDVPDLVQRFRKQR
ncbi:MAG: AbrB/MazE/SpoVT family DNA-binding domain-containing protein [archaeon]